MMQVLKKARRKAVTLVELTLGLALAALVIFGAVRAYSMAQENNRTHQLVQEIGQVRAAVASKYEIGANYASLTSANIVPQMPVSLLDSSRSKIMDPFGGEVVVEQSGQGTDTLLSVKRGPDLCPQPGHRYPRPPRVGPMLWESRHAPEWGLHMEQPAERRRHQRFQIARPCKVHHPVSRRYVAAETLDVAAIYTVPVEQQWVSRIHKALMAAKDRGEITYVWSENTANTTNDQKTQINVDSLSSFKALGWSPSGPVLYQYDIVSGAAGCGTNSSGDVAYTFSAFGDIDADSTASTFELQVGVDTEGVRRDARRTNPSC